MASRKRMPVIQSETGTPRKNRGQFQKGDARINRHGRPRSFDAFRKLALAIAVEPHPRAKKEFGAELSHAETILRQWARGNHQAQKDFIEVAYGKVPDELKQNGNFTLRVVWTDETTNDSTDDSLAAPASTSTSDSTE